MAKKPAIAEPQEKTPTLVWEEYGMMRAVAQAARAYLEQDLAEDIRNLNLRPEIKAEYSAGYYGDEFECLICGTKAKFPPGKQRIRYEAHLRGWDQQQRVRLPSWVGRVCRVCLEGGAEKALDNLREQIVTRCVQRCGKDDRYLHGQQIEDAVTLYKLVRESLPRIAWWPRGRELQRVDNRAVREASESQKRWLREVVRCHCACGYPILERLPDAHHTGGYYDGQKKSPNFSQKIEHCPQCGQWAHHIRLVQPSGHQPITKKAG